MFSIVDALKREDYAIGVIAVALGVEAMRTAGKVSHLGTDSNRKMSRAHMICSWGAINHDTDVDVCSARTQPTGPIIKDAGAVFSIVDALKREDYAIGVIAVALGVEAMRTAGKVSHLGTDSNRKMSRAHMICSWGAINHDTECKSPQWSACAAGGAHHPTAASGGQCNSKRSQLRPRQIKDSGSGQGATVAQRLSRGRAQAG